MIAIDTVITQMVGHEEEAMNNLFTRAHPDLFQFFTDVVINQNLVINTLFWQSHNDDQSSGLIRYYAINMANAEIFKEKLIDESADFSVKKYMNQIKYNFSVECVDINFDNEMPQYYVVNHETSGFWGDTWPLQFYPPTQ